MKKVLLFACIEKNIGDDLFIYTLCQRYKNIDFYISKDAEYGALKELENLHFCKSIKIWNRFNIVDSSSKIKNMIAYCITKILGWTCVRYDKAVYIVGNAFKNYEYKGKRDSRWIVERVKLVKDFFLLSTNFGPYNNQQWKKDFDTIYPMMRDICFRDKESYGLFNDIKNVRYAPDTVLSLGKREKSSNKDKVILISLIDCLYYARADKIKKCSKEYESKLAELIDYFAEKEYKIILLNSNTEQDMPAAKRIYSACEKQENVTIYEYAGNYNEVFELYKKATFVIGTRLHTIILAWLYDIPVFPIIYDIKVKNMLESYGFSEDKVELEKMGELLPQRVEKAIEQYRFDSVDSLINEAQHQFEILDKELIGD